MAGRRVSAGGGYPVVDQSHHAPDVRGRRRLHHTRSSSVITLWPATRSESSPFISLHAIKNSARIEVPIIGVGARMVHVGNRCEGSMDLHPTAWPPGTSSLGELKPRDVILVFDRNGDSATFQVDSSELTLKQEPPIGRIWNKTTEPRLRLITCGGKWNAPIGRYLSNLIVHCHLVK
jgi:Sortase domain